VHQRVLVSNAIYPTREMAASAGPRCEHRGQRRCAPEWLAMQRPNAPRWGERVPCGNECWSRPLLRGRAVRAIITEQVA